MKRFLLYSLGLSLAAVMMASCGGDDPLPLPVPSFEASTEFEIYEIAQPIKFINSTTNASSYTWDFGDGGTSTEINPEYTYSEPGDYIITLTAITDDEQTDTATLTVDVGQRELTALGVLSIDFNNRDANGNIEGPWDTGNGPDIVMIFGPEDDPNFESTVFTPVVPDIIEPFSGFGFELNEKLPLTDEPWSLVLLDDDNDVEANAVEVMIQANGFNPIVNSNTQIDPDQGIGRITISGGGFEIFLDFEIN